MLLNYDNIMKILLLPAHPSFGHAILTLHVPKVLVPIRRDPFCKWVVYIIVKLSNLLSNNLAHNTIIQLNSGDTSRGMHSPEGKNCIWH